MLVRRATREDALKIAEYAMKLVEQHVGYDPVRFSRIATMDGMAGFYGSQTESDTAAVLVAEIDKQVVGFAYVGYEERSYEDLAVTVASIHDIYVDEAARHSGAGRALIDGSVRAAKEFGASKVMLHVAVMNDAANRFFEECGFRPTMTEMMLPLDEADD